MAAENDEVENEPQEKLADVIEQPTVVPAPVQSPSSESQEVPVKQSRLTWDQNVTMLYANIANIAAEEPVSRATLVDIMAKFGYAEGTVSAALWSLAHEGFILAPGDGFYRLNKAMQGEVHSHAERRRSAMRQKRQT